MTCEVYMNYKFEGLSIKFYYNTVMLNPYATFTIQWQSGVLGHRLYGLKKQNYLLFGPLKKKNADLWNRTGIRFMPLSLDYKFTGDKNCVLVHNDIYRSYNRLWSSGNAQ